MLCCNELLNRQKIDRTLINTIAWLERFGRGHFPKIFGDPKLRFTYTVQFTCKCMHHLLRYLLFEKQISDYSSITIFNLARTES